MDSLDLRVKIGVVAVAETVFGVGTADEFVGVLATAAKPWVHC